MFGPDNTTLDEHDTAFSYLASHFLVMDGISLNDLLNKHTTFQDDGWMLIQYYHPKSESTRQITCNTVQYGDILLEMQKRYHPELFE